MAQLRLSCLGSPEVRSGDQLLAFPTRKALALLVYLAVEGGLHPREKLSTFLWPESDAVRGRGALRTTLAHLRRTLAPALTGGSQAYLIGEGDTLGFDAASDYKLDLDIVITPAEAGQVAPLQEAVVVYRGDFLEGFSLPDAPAFDEWATFQRERWHRQMNTVFDRLSQLQSERQDFAGGIETAVRWVAHDPLHEAAHRRLMQLYFMTGDRTTALQAYTTCQTILEAELGIEPSAETKTLAQRIRTAGPPRQALAAAVQPAPLAELPLVGRAAEHSQMASVYNQASQGTAHAVVVMGEAGIGKTRLARAFLVWASLAPVAADVLRGRAFEVGGRLPYQPLVEALRTRLEAENAPEDLLADVWLAELSQLLPELRDRYPDLPPPMSGGPDFVRARIFEAVARLVEALAAQQPVVLFVDDIQWADEGTLDMLHYLSRRWAQGQTRILLLLTVRQEALTTTPSLHDWLANVDRDISLAQLQLPALTKAAVQQLISVLAGGATGDSVAEQSARVEAFGAWLQAETGGVPFFMEAMLQMLIEQGLLARQQGHGRSFFDIAAVWEQIQSERRLPLPPGVRDVILSRLDRLNEDARALLLAGAVIGRACSFELLCQVAGVAELEGLEALEALLSNRLLLETGPDLRPYTFAHDNIREVVYTEAGEARRRIYHRRALTMLERDKAPAAELAFQAAAARLDEPAFRYSLGAGDEAMATYAAAEALAHYNQALALAKHKPLPMTSGQFIHLYSRRGRAYELLTRFDEALRNYQGMGELAVERADDALKLASLSAQCILQATQTPLYNPPEARKAGEAALTLARELGDRATEARVLWGLLLVEAWGGGDNHKALAYGQRSLAIARELGLKEQMGYTLTNLVNVYWNLDQMAAARETNLEARAIWLELDNMPMLADSYTMTQLVHWLAGEYELTLSAAKEGMRVSQSIGNIWNHAAALTLSAVAHLEQGDLGQALENLAQELRLGEETHLNSITTRAYRNLASTYLAAGALDEAERFSDELYDLRDAIVFLYRKMALGVCARVKIACGKQQEAQRVLDEACADIELEKQPVMLIGFVLPADMRLQLALGKPERALERAQHLVDRARQSGVRLFLPEGLWLQGKALLALEEAEQARQVWREARAVAEETGARRFLWQILADLAEIEALLGNLSEAESMRGQAREIVAYIGDHTGSANLSASFLALPEVRAVLNSS